MRPGDLRSPPGEAAWNPQKHLYGLGVIDRRHALHCAALIWFAGWSTPALLLGRLFLHDHKDLQPLAVVAILLGMLLWRWLEV
jgi:hypothetical protein